MHPAVIFDGRDLDLARIRRILSLLEAALSQSDLVPTFEAIVSESPRS